MSMQERVQLMALDRDSASMRLEHCNALRRMFTTLRMNRLLQRWKTTALFLVSQELLRLEALEQRQLRELVEDTRRQGERAAAAAATRSAALGKLEAAIGDGVLIKLGRRLAAWRGAVVVMQAEESLRQERQSHDDACWREAGLKQRLEEQTGELQHAKVGSARTRARPHISPHISNAARGAQLVDPPSF